MALEVVSYLEPGHEIEWPVLDFMGACWNVPPRHYKRRLWMYREKFLNYTTTFRARRQLQSPPSSAASCCRSPRTPRASVEGGAPPASARGGAPRASASGVAHRASARWSPTSSSGPSVPRAWPGSAPSLTRWSIPRRTNLRRGCTVTGRRLECTPNRVRQVLRFRGRWT